MNRLAAMVMCAVLLAGCGDDPLGPEDYDISGTWSGSITSPSTMTVTVTITETNGSIHGSGNLAGASTSLACTVTGSRAGANVSMTIAVTGFYDMNYTGEITTETRMVGSLTGSGFENQSLTLTKN